MYLNLLTLHLLMVLLYQIVRWQHWPEPVEQREAAAESYKFCLELDVAACGRSLSLPPASRATRNDCHGSALEWVSQNKVWALLLGTSSGYQMPAVCL